MECLESVWAVSGVVSGVVSQEECLGRSVSGGVGGVFGDAVVCLGSVRGVSWQCLESAWDVCQESGV